MVQQSKQHASTRQQKPRKTGSLTDGVWALFPVAGTFSQEAGIPGLAVAAHVREPG
jgi:hypothetical protein